MTERGPGDPMVIYVEWRKRNESDPDPEWPDDRVVESCHDLADYLAITHDEAWHAFLTACAEDDTDDAKAAFREHPSTWVICRIWHASNGAPTVAQLEAAAYNAVVRATSMVGRWN